MQLYGESSSIFLTFLLSPFSHSQVIESINLSLVVGLAVDYVVHLSEAYHTSPQKHRSEKVRDMLEQMGVSVISGAFSTLGASSFMMAAQIQFFLQFGIFLFLTIGFSLIYSLFLFTPLLSVIGPEGNTGSVVPIISWIWNKIIGRKKDDVKCGVCEGKGFHGPDVSESEPREMEETPMREIGQTSGGYRSPGQPTSQEMTNHPTPSSLDGEILTGTVVKF